MSTVFSTRRRWRAGVVVFLAATSAFVFMPVAAQIVPEGVTFPIADLDGCATPEACAQYCDDPLHREACISFAKAHGMEYSSAHDVDFPVAELGGCTSPEDCMAYCEDGDRAEACLEFAHDNGLMPDEEYEKVRQVLPLLQAGEGPGGCRSEMQCRDYCQDMAHLEECLDFGVKSGFMTAEEAQRIRSTGGRGPGDCSSEAQCRAFCETPANMEVCIQFARDHGMMSEEEADRAHRFAAQGFQGPGGCTDQASCQQYCGEPANAQVCITFAHDMGAMSDAEYERAMQSGPGGCRSMEECQAYCQTHHDECPAMGGGQPPGGVPPEMPQPCRDQALTPEQCYAYCQQNSQACGYTPPPEGYAPPPEGYTPPPEGTTPPPPPS